MTTRIRQRYAIIIGAALTLSVLIIGLSLYGAGQLNPAPAASDKLAVAATIFPLADIARNIGGDYVNVTLIIPPGASEHASDLSPRQLQSLAQAQAIFQIGHGLDTALTARIAAATKTAELVTVDRGISLGEFSLSGEDEHDHDSGIDPHYWLTVPNAKLIAQTISQTLQELDPANATHYSLQTTNYKLSCRARCSRARITNTGPRCLHQRIYRHAQRLVIFGRSLRTAVGRNV